MDRSGRRARLLIVIAAGSLGLAATTADPPLRAARWLSGDGRIASLAMRPAICPPPAAEARSVAIGIIAFRTPLLLGGQAARAGLACESCHNGGRTNPVFHFPGLSGAPGTADITSSLMSSHRGDGHFDPVPIPDLAHPGKISRDPASRALENFIRGLIVEEFDGSEPSPAVLYGLVAYVRSQQGCQRGPEQLGLANYLADIDRAIAAATHAAREGDRVTARLMIAGARNALGLIDERYTGITAPRVGLRDADLGLAAIQQAIDHGDPAIPDRIAAWAARDGWIAPLRQAESRSLFNRIRLERALDRH